MLADVAVERRRPEKPLKGWKHGRVGSGPQRRSRARLKPYELLAELPSSSSSLGSDRTSARSQGKLATVEEEVPMDRETRRMARRSELTEGDDQYPGAKGTKDAPGRFTSRSHRTSPYLLSQANPWVWKSFRFKPREVYSLLPPLCLLQT